MGNDGERRDVWAEYRRRRTVTWALPLALIVVAFVFGITTNYDGPCAVHSRCHCSGRSPIAVVSTLALSAMREAVCAVEARLSLFQTMLALWSRPLERPGRRGRLPREAASSGRYAEIGRAH